LSVRREELVPALLLSRRRRFLGYIIPLLNIPLFAFEAYLTYVHLSSGMPVSSPEFLNDLLLLGLTLCLGLILPWWAPIYASRYRLTGDGVIIERFLRGSATIPCASIVRVEVYLKREPRGEVTKEAIRYARDAVEAMRKGGLKVSDYTNAEEAIVLLLTNRRVYMLSPESPKSLIKRLRHRVPRLPVRLVELTSKGKRVRDLGA